MWKNETYRSLNVPFQRWKLYMYIFSCIFAQIPPREKESRAVTVHAPLCHLTLGGGRNENRSSTYRAPMIHLIPRVSLTDVSKFHLKRHRARMILFSGGMDDKSIKNRWSVPKQRATLWNVAEMKQAPIRHFRLAKYFCPRRRTRERLYGNSPLYFVIAFLEDVSHRKRIHRNR